MSVPKDSICCQVEIMKSLQSGRIRELEEKIADPKARLPRRSVSASMPMEPAELQDEFMQLQAQGTSDETRDLVCNHA